jgi:KaiC/GvpD/RAD55 family RecA-like ATPase
LTTISSLLSDSVGAILVKGAPGSGKTTFAIELMREAGGGIYISTRVSKRKLMDQIPGVKELIITSESTEDSTVPVKMEDSRLASAFQVLNQVIQAGKQSRGQLIVLDSWDAIAKEIPTVERLKTEKTLLVIAEGSDSKLVFISEEPEYTTLGYLVDAVVELKRELQDGAVVRTLESQKLRGNAILRPKSLFTLVGSNFTEFAPSLPNPVQSVKRGDFQPVKHRERSYSSGLKELDEGFSGGFRKGSVNLLEFGENLNPAVHNGIFNVIYSNFILNGGCGLTIPGGGSDLQEVVDLAKLSMPADAVVKYLAVGAFEKYDDPSFFYLPPTSIEDCFDTLWKRIAALKGGTNRPLTSVIGVDLLESIFDNQKLLYYLSRTLQLVRRNQDVIALTCGNSSNLRHKLADLSDIHAKYETIDESLVLHSLNPPGPFMHIAYDFSRGYPYPVFTPIL